MKKIIIYFGNPETCPPCMMFHSDLEKIEPVFKAHEIEFVNGSVGSFPLSAGLFSELRNRMDRIQRIPQFHFFEVGVSGDIVKYKSEVGYGGEIGFVRKVEEIFQLINKVTISTRYRKKPEFVDAIQFNGNSNKGEVEKFVGKELKAELESETAYIAGKGAPIFSLWLGNAQVFKDDWIVREPEGLYSVMHDVNFVASYEEAI